ncbi:MAG: PTS system mannose/fructose/sorbose family transporter subunit IID, partial [Traorella sp.]
MSNQTLSKDDKKLVNELFWHSFLLEACYNYERQQGLGFCLNMVPAIKRFYKTKEEQSEALVRHMAIYNTTPHVSGMIAGVAAAMEKEASENPEFDKEAINSVKVGLMGPMAGLGDSFFWGTFRIIASGIAISLAQQGSPLAPIVFLFVFNIPHIIVRYFGTKYGYMFGTKLMTN